MKENYFRILVLMLFIGTGFSGTIFGQLIKTAYKSTAVKGTQYVYDVNVFPIGDSTFFLDKKPTDMTIDANTGVITWTPTSLNGAEIVVRVVVGSFTENQSFFIYVSDAVVCDNNMLSYWNFDESSGTTFTDFKSGYNAITGVAPEVVDGIVSNGQKFDASRDIRLSVANNADQYGWMSGDDISGAIWFKSAVDIETRPQVFMGRMGTAGSTTNRHWWWFGLDIDNYVAVELSNNVGTLNSGDVGYPNQIISHSTSGVHYDDGEWHFAVFTLEGNTSNQYTLKIYVDGALKSSVTKTLLAGNFTSSAELNIGWWQNPWSLDCDFDGSLDEPVLYSRSLVLAEIEQMYLDGLAEIPYCKPGNYAPVFKSEPVTVSTEDITYTYNIIVGDYDIGDVPTISKITGPAWLNSFTDNGDGTAKLMGTPSNTDVGNHPVTLRVSDTKSNVDQVFTISVTNVNDKPVFTSTAVTNVAEDGVYNYSITTQDMDAGSSVTISAVTTLPSWLTLTNTGNGTATLTGTPVNENVGTFNITLRATDNLATFNDQTYTLTVANVNDQPVIMDQALLSTSEDENIVLSLNDFTVTDVDNNYPVDFSLEVFAGEHYTFSGTTITPEADWNGTLSVFIAISDLSITVIETITIEVEAVNDLPTITSIPVTAAAVNTPYEYWVSATDVEDQTVTFEAVSKPSWASFSYNSTLKLGILQGTPAATDANSANVSIKITDSNGGSDIQDFVILVSGGATSVKNANSTDAIKIYPIPVKDYAFIEIASGFGRATFQVLTLTGQLVKEVEIANEHVTKIDLSDLSQGQYIGRLIGSDKQSICKIIKE